MVEDERKVKEIQRAEKEKHDEMIKKERQEKEAEENERRRKLEEEQEAEEREKKIRKEKAAQFDQICIDQVNERTTHASAAVSHARNARCSLIKYTDA